MSKLNKDILFLIFEEFKDNLNSLYHCLLVNRQWCETVVPILWRDPYINVYLMSHITLRSLSIESKEFLSRKGINIERLCRKKPQPLFDYISYCKYLRYDNIINCAEFIIFHGEDKDKRLILEQEIFKLYVSKCSSIKYLDIGTIFRTNTMNYLLSEFHGAINCFSNLCELHCNSNIDSYIFHRLSLICKSIQKINITMLRYKNNGLIRLIEVQKNLKSFKYSVDGRLDKNEKRRHNEIGRVLLKHAENLIQFKTTNDYYAIGYHPNILSNFKNLEKLVLTEFFDDKLQYILEDQLRIIPFLKLKVLQVYGIPLYTIKMIIEKTEGSLTKIAIFDTEYIKNHNDQLIKTIYLYCPNLQLLRLKIDGSDLKEFEDLLIRCQQLEGLVIESHRMDTLDDSKLLNLLAESAPISLCKIKLYDIWNFAKDSLVAFFESWKGRRKPLWFHEVNLNNYVFGDRFQEIFEKYLNETIVGLANINVSNGKYFICK